MFCSVVVNNWLFPLYDSHVGLRAARTIISLKLGAQYATSGGSTNALLSPENTLNTFENYGERKINEERKKW